MPALAQFDPATLELINLLLRANILQLIVLAPVLVMILQILHTLINARRLNQQTANDDKLINRMIDIAERANDNTEQANNNNASLKDAIENLANASREKEREKLELERERIDIHRANRESILAQQEAVNTLVINVQNLGHSWLTWSKLVDDNTNNIQRELERLTSELKQLRAVISTPDHSGLEKIVESKMSAVLEKLDTILNRLPPPPPTEPDSASTGKTKPLTNADGAAHHATVDLPVVPDSEDKAA